MTALYFRIASDAQSPDKRNCAPRNLAHEPKDKEWSPSQYIIRMTCNCVQTMHKPLGNGVLMVY